MEKRAKSNKLFDQFYFLFFFYQMKHYRNLRKNEFFSLEKVARNHGDDLILVNIPP